MARIPQRLGALGLIGLAVSTPFAIGQAPSGQAQFPAGPGQQVVQRMCSGCHGSEWITNRRETRDKWTDLVMEMVSRGAQGSDQDITTVVNYLATHYGRQAAESPTPNTSAPQQQPSNHPIVPQTPVVAAISSIPSSDVRSQWQLLGGDPGAQRHSALNQINRSNVGGLTLAWSYKMTLPTPPEPPTPAKDANSSTPIRRRLTTQITPLVAEGRMYLTTPDGRLLALDPDTGNALWSYTIPDSYSTPGARALAYRHADNALSATIFVGTNGGFLLSIDAVTGQPRKDFGKDGALDLRTSLDHVNPKDRVGLSSPPVFYKDLVITGSRVQEEPAMGPAGDIRAWNARTGTLAWIFHTIPRPGETGSETWSGDSWQGRSGTNVWGLMTVDEQRGTVFLPIGSATFDYDGADRPGTNLYANSLVALDAETGKRKWSFQSTHHDIWDYDLNSAPVLLEIKRNGYTIPAVAQLSKQGMLFVLDRTTGQPVYPIEERPVPQDGFPASEHPWPTQPFPTLTPQVARAYFDPKDISDITPEHKKACEDILARNGGLRTGGTYLPYSERPSIMFPGTLGGSNWQGGTFDPDTGYLVTATMDLGEVFQSIPNPKGGARINKRYKFWDDDKHWPCSAGPWGELVAVNMNTGQIAWRVPFGDFPELVAKGIKGMGTPVLGGGITTAGGLTFVGGTLDDRFRAFDTRSGTELWSVDVGAAVHAIPMTYLGASGLQYVAFTVSGGGFLEDHTIPPILMVYALPKTAIAPK